MILELIDNAKSELIRNGVKPKYIRLSPMAHQSLVNEINRERNIKSLAVFEVFGLTVQIESECPSGTGYLLGEEKQYG